MNNLDQKQNLDQSVIKQNTHKGEKSATDTFRSIEYTKSHISIGQLVTSSLYILCALEVFL